MGDCEKQECYDTPAFYLIGLGCQNYLSEG